MQDAEHLQAQGLVPCKDQLGIRGARNPREILGDGFPRLSANPWDQKLQDTTAI